MANEYHFHTLAQIVSFINSTKDTKHINDTLDSERVNSNTWDIESLGNQKELNGYYYHCCRGQFKIYRKKLCYLWKQLNTLKLKDGERETTLAKVLLDNYIRNAKSVDNMESHVESVQIICKIIGEDGLPLTDDYFGMHSAVDDGISFQTYEFIFANGPGKKDIFSGSTAENIINKMLNIKRLRYHYYYNLCTWIIHYEKVQPGRSENFWLKTAIKLFNQKKSDWYLFDDHVDRFESGVRKIIYYSKNSNNHDTLIRYIKNQLLRECRATRKRAHIDVNSIIQILIDKKVITLEDIVQLM